MTTPTLTDLSFSVWYEQGTGEWCAKVRELPMKLVAKAVTPAEALVALNHHVNELLAHLDPRQPEFSTISALDWETAMERASVTPSDIVNSIKEKSLSRLMDEDQVGSIAEEIWNREGDTNDNDREPFMDGFRRGVSAALGATF